MDLEKSCLLILLFMLINRAVLSSARGLQLQSQQYGAFIYELIRRLVLIVFYVY